MITVMSSPLPAEKDRGLSGKLRALEAQCKQCNPITPFECIRCKVYKLKNELRQLKGVMDNPDYIKELFNVLKNQTRLYILQAIVNDKCSISKLQQQLKAAQLVYSQETLINKYLRPLLSVGLAYEAHDEYYATAFGTRIAKPLSRLPDLAKLPAHSEGHEETILKTLLSEPKTFQDLSTLMPPKIATRVLKRLQLAGLITAPKDRDYMFFFKSKRDPNIEVLTATEQKVYDAIDDEGTSAGKLAKKSGLCVRRIYKYVKRLKGKKLVFLRRTPKTYKLTDKGGKLALALVEIERIVEDTWDSSQQVMH